MTQGPFCAEVKCNYSTLNPIDMIKDDIKISMFTEFGGVWLA